MHDPKRRRLLTTLVIGVAKVKTYSILFLFFDVCLELFLFFFLFLKDSLPTPTLITAIVFLDTLL